MNANIRLAGRSYCGSKMAGEATECRSSWRSNLCITLFIGSLVGLVSVGSYLNRAGMFVNPRFAPQDYNSSSAALQRVLHVNKNRKLLGTDRNTCTYTDISISQRLDGSPGIPQYTVQITNSCMSTCAPKDIHVACGWFASAPLVSPLVFKRVGYDDCLVNNGKPLDHGTVIRFSYSNSFMYSLKLKSASFC